MSGEILDTDFLTGTRTLFHPDVQSGEKNIIETVQDCEPVIEFNKAQYNQYDERTPFKGDGFHKVASIPNVVFMKLVKDGITSDPAAFKKWLNDRENSAFRTRPGRV